MAAGALEIALYEPGRGGGSRAVGGTVDFHLVLPATPFDALAADLLRAGHLAEDRVHTGNDGSTFVDVRDPDGNVLKVMRRAA